MSEKLKNLHERADFAESEIASLKEKLVEIERAVGSSGGDGESSEELTQLRQENVKLKHRIAILLRTVEAERAKARGLQGGGSSNSSEKMESILETLTEIFRKAINKAYPDLKDPPIPVTLSTDPRNADYQCNSAFQLPKLIAPTGPKPNPKQVAEKIFANIEMDEKTSSLIEKIDINGPGYMTIKMRKDYGLAALTNLLRAGKVLPPNVNRQRMIVDFSSPNIAKEMHVGHLRSTIIGESIARVLEYIGHDVLRLNHVGDWGTQFGMLIAHLQDKFPDYATVSPPIEDLQAFYKESKSRFDTDEEFKKRAYSCVVSLQAHEPNIKKAWEMICDVSRKEFQKLYDRLDITLIERGESFYQEHMEKIVKYLNENGYLEEDEGRKIMWGTEERTGVPFTIVKSDGGFTYDTSDIACIKHRVEEEKAKRIIYVTDAGQGVHFETLENCAKRLGLLNENVKMDHVTFGVVLGEDKKKFKTRSGDTVKLIELLDEGLKRALQTLIDKGRDKELTEQELKQAQESVAYGCIKYSDLCHNRVHEYVFSFDKMLEDRGNTAVYLLYALTRIRSIARTAKVTPEQLREALGTTAISLEHEREWKLAKVLLKFPDVLLKITKDLYLHPLCEFCYEIATVFSEFYDKCYCVEKNREGEIVKVNMGRLLLTEVTAIMLEQCFYLLGLKPVSKM